MAANAFAIIKKSDRVTMMETAMNAVKNDPTLADIPSDFMEQCRPWLDMMTNPTRAFVLIDPFIDQLISLAGGEINKHNKALVKKSLLRILHGDPTTFAHAFEGLITFHRGKYNCNKGFVVAVDYTTVLFTRLIELVPDLFGGQHINVENFHRILLAAFQHYRATYERLVQSNTNRDEQRLATQTEKNRMATVLRQNGVNPTFGTTAIVDKKFLNIIAPGPGTQKRKICAARNNPDLKVGSCSAELNGPEQGLRAFVFGTLNSRLTQAANFVDSPDAASKRRCIQQVADTILDAVQVAVDVAYEGMSNDEIHVRVYNPLAAGDIAQVV